MYLHFTSGLVQVQLWAIYGLFWQRDVPWNPSEMDGLSLGACLLLSARLLSAPASGQYTFTTDDRSHFYHLVHGKKNNNNNNKKTRSHLRTIVLLLVSWWLSAFLPSLDLMPRAGSGQVSLSLCQWLKCPLLTKSMAL